MKYILLVFLIHFSCIQVSAQEDSIPPKRDIDTSAVRRMPRRLGPKEKEKEEEPEELTIKDYKIISYARDTTFLDTTLTIQKEYKYNYLRKDDFELMPFANVGKPYNKLGVDFTSNNLYPSLGATALHSNYFEKEDIDYYNVATPMSDLLFKTTFEQGQLLDANLAFNTSRRLNFSLAYKGFRSLGKYQYNQSESGNFRTTTNYVTKNNRYSLRAHIAAQNIENMENGGLVDEEGQFESGLADFSNRVKIDVRFSDANSKILGKRYFFDHLYKLIRKEKDSSRQEKTSLGIGHQFNYETKYYAFNQTTPNEYYGNNLVSPIEDKASLKTMYNQVNAEFYNATLGRLQGNISLYNYNYFFNSILINEDGVTIPSRLKGEEIALGAEYEKRIKGFQLKATAKYNLSGELGGNQMNASASYRLNDKHKITASAFGSSKMPDFNFLLYQSDYENYNWLNLSNFEKEQVYGLRLDFESELWGDLMVSYQTVDNYTYFGQDPSVILEEGMENATIRPLQEGNVLNHTKVKYAKEFKLGGFALNNTVMYQNVSQANQVLNVPELVTRNTLYFSSDVFKKAMFMQTGVTLKYFTAYNMDAYNSLLGEFYLQNDQKLGNFPMLDFFINAKIQQTRIYLKAEHFNSLFIEKPTYYSAPGYPYRDFVIRFGLVWNFFS
ncbi:putative porin [Zobellia russellii]|uniref:putative porin n=1 Tax=Zobellia russellii TaxID=248907 RepID=UPI001BFEF15A|nr:putative porin [Zobellia russellii]MBT9187716.1 putative porin [Zobellia russellii]